MAAGAGVVVLQRWVVVVVLVLFVNVPSLPLHGGLIVLCLCNIVGVGWYNWKDETSCNMVKREISTTSMMTTRWGRLRQRPGARSIFLVGLLISSVMLYDLQSLIPFYSSISTKQQ